MKPGTQIAYVPTHADGIDHPDVEFGFVTSERDNAHFCRYWRKGHLGTMRTIANSELTLNDCLVEYVSVNQQSVDIWLEKKYDYSELTTAIKSYLSRFLGPK